MTTNLNAIAGPSKLPPSPLVEIESPTHSMDSPGRDAHRGLTQEPTVSRPGLSVDENGEIIKVPAFLNKLFRSVFMKCTREKLMAQYGIGYYDRSAHLLVGLGRFILW
jgi:heat shock transcription factor